MVKFNKGGKTIYRRSLHVTEVFEVKNGTAIWYLSGTKVIVSESMDTVMRVVFNHDEGVLNEVDDKAFVV